MASLRAPKWALSTRRSNRTPRILSPAPPSGSSVNACSSVPCCVRSAVLAAARMCTSAVSSSKPSCELDEGAKPQASARADGAIAALCRDLRGAGSLVLSAWSNPAPGGSVRRGPGCRAGEC